MTTGDVLCSGNAPQTADTCGANGVFRMSTSGMLQIHPRGVACFSKLTSARVLSVAGSAAWLLEDVCSGESVCLLLV